MDGRFVSLAEGPMLVMPNHPEALPALLGAARALCAPLDRSATLVYASEPPLSPELIRAHLYGAAALLGGIVIAPLAGNPAQAIPAYAREQRASLLILALPAEPLLHDGLAVRLMADAPCPVLLVPPHLRAGWGAGGTVLLPLDGTPSTSGAVPWATEFAVSLGAALEILYAAGNPPPSEAGSMSFPVFSDQPQHEWPMWRREFLARFCDCYWKGQRPVEPHVVVRAAPPAQAILSYAGEHDPDLIVLGWHGRLSGGHAATLRAVLAQARWPLLAVKVEATG